MFGFAGHNTVAKWSEVINQRGSCLEDIPQAFGEGMYNINVKVTQRHEVRKMINFGGAIFFQSSLRQLRENAPRSLLKRHKSGKTEERRDI